MQESPQPNPLASQFSILIPAYDPSENLITFVTELAATNAAKIIVVNDGSSKEKQAIFSALHKLEKVEVLTNAVNLGKGAALKLGLNYILANFPEQSGVITADADGQHLVKDILQVSTALLNHPKDLVVGVRSFNEGVPLRSKIGNILTKKIFSIVVGTSLSDTQSGLRGIPMDFIPALLKINTNGYEYELDMLLTCKNTHRHITEQPITTVYIDNNSSSHFNPLIDSLKIYFVLFRYMLLSLSTASIDYIVFFLVHSISGNILLSQASARCASVMFNYPIVKKVVFFSNAENKYTFPKYLLLVIVSGTLSYLMINYLVAKFGFSVLIAKITSELIIYLGNFAVQRDFIFSAKQKQQG